jgi:hypothetical protein
MQLLPLTANWPGVVVSLEASWFPWFPGGLPAICRLDRALLFQPSTSWEAGLAENGGPFAVPATLRARVVPVGLAMGSAIAPELHHGVLLYMAHDLPSGQAAPWHPYLGNIGRAIELAAQRLPGVEWSLVGGNGVEMPGFVRRWRNWIPMDEFQDMVASSQLVVSHFAWATFSRALTAGARVLALNDGNVWHHEGENDTWQDREIQALALAGLIDVVYGDPAPAEAIARRIVALVEAGPREPEPGNGAARAVEVVTGLIEKGG